jgi:hypothetical protein
MSARLYGRVAYARGHPVSAVPLKGSGSASEYQEIDRYDGGVGWIAYPDERMERATHALADGDDVYLVDPLAIPDVEEVVEPYGEIAGIVVLLGRHSRDAVDLADRFDVPIHLPAWVDIDPESPVDIRRHDRTLGETGFDIIETVNWPGWREASLFDGETLVVPEAVGTGEFYLADEEELGVHAVLRMTPPKALRGVAPDRILVGHGAGIHENAAEHLRRALEESRRNAPGAWLNALSGG